LNAEACIGIGYPPKLRIVVVLRFVQEIVKRIDEAVVYIKGPASAGKLLVFDTVNMEEPVNVDVRTEGMCYDWFNQIEQDIAWHESCRLIEMMISPAGSSAIGGSKDNPPFIWKTALVKSQHIGWVKRRSDILRCVFCLDVHPAVKQSQSRSSIEITIPLADVGEVKTTSGKREADITRIVVKGIAHRARKAEHADQAAKESGRSLPHDQLIPNWSSTI